MIECVFTIDYEIYGNGEGLLADLVYEPASRLVDLFVKHDFRFVVFAEAAELEMIESNNTDPSIGDVTRQLKSLHDGGFEVALHLHPQWYRGEYRQGKWLLDYSEYNLCTQPEERVNEIIGRSIAYLKGILKDEAYNPFSFRAGNWLLQPTGVIARALSRHGIKVDTSVFKGGLQHQHGLDYRRSLKNAYYWRFQEDVNVPQSNGVLLEIPIYTHMVPFWRMATTKRIGLQRKGPSGTGSVSGRINRFRDMMRARHPLKLDFCRMTIAELTKMMEMILEEERRDPKLLKPVVAIGHTKDLVDFETVDIFLSYLKDNGIAVSTLDDVYSRCSVVV